MSAPTTIEAGRELDAKIAFHLFGWRWFQRNAGGLITKQRCAFFPPDDENWIRWNFHYSFEQISEWPEPDRRFSDWDRCGGPSVPVGSQALIFLPLYSSDWRDMRLVVERMRELDWLAQLVQQSSDYWEASFMNDSEDWVEERSKSLPHAICLAALAAIQSQGQTTAGGKL